VILRKMPLFLADTGQSRIQALLLLKAPRVKRAPCNSAEDDPFYNSSHTPLLFAEFSLHMIVRLRACSFQSCQFKLD
jgi:hypothetical protein